MKKILLGTLMVGALASSSFAIFQMDVDASLFPEGQAPESAVMTLFGNPTPFAQTGITGPDGFPLMYHVLFDYDAVVPGGAVASVALSSGDCTQTWTPAMFTVFYTPGPAFPNNGVYQAYTPDCYGPSCFDAVCEIAPMVLDFGVQEYPAHGWNPWQQPPAPLSFTICNVGAAPSCEPLAGTISEQCEAIEVNTTSYSLEAGECVTVEVSFVGGAEGAFACEIMTGCGPVVVTGDIVVAADEQPAVFSLAEAYPNPFNPTTTIAYSVPENQEVVLNVFNTAGQLVQTLVNGMVERGEHKVVFDASSLSSGVYVYTLRTANETATQKMVLVK